MIREGVVIGKNDKYVSSQETPIERLEVSPFQVYLNKVELPLFKSQTKIIDNEFFLLTEITQYIFNIEVNNKYSKIIEGQKFVNIAALAKSLEYKVIKMKKYFLI